MKATRLILITVLTLILVVVSACGEGEEASGKTYTNYTYDYSVDYPDTWIVRDSQKDRVFIDEPYLEAYIMIEVKEDVSESEAERAASISTLAIEEVAYYFELVSQAKIRNIHPTWKLTARLQMYEDSDMEWMEYYTVFAAGRQYGVALVVEESKKDIHQSTLADCYNSFHLSSTSETSISAQDWDALNLWLGELYGLPPVYSVEDLKSAAWLVSNLWFDVAEEAVAELEQYDIPWARTAPFCYLYYWYIEADIKLRSVLTPIEFVASDYVLAEHVRWLEETARDLVDMKLSGEPLNIYPTEDACVEGWID